MNEQQKYQKRNLLLFPLGTVGRDAVYALINSFLLTFVLFTRSLNAAQLTAITAIMVAARIFDALNDPIMGSIIEHTHSRFGKFKPWLTIGVLSTSVVIYLFFNTDLHGWSFVCLFGILYFLFSITYTMNDISYWGMIPALGSDANARNQFTSRATLFAGIGSTLASILIPVFSTGKNAIGGSSFTAYGRIALIIAILAPLFLSITIFGVRERRDPPAAKQERFRFREIIQTILRNDQLVWIAVIFLLQQIGNGMIVGGLGSTYIYLTFGYEGGLYSLFTMVGMSATAFLMVFYPAISRKCPRKQLMSIMAIIAVIGYAFLLISGFLAKTGTLGFALLVLGYMLSNFGQYCYYLIMMISILNTVEYNEYKFETRDEAVIASLRPFITKLASALIAVLTSATYLLFDVTSYTNQISSLEQQCTQGLITESEKLDLISGVLSSTTSLQSTGLLLCMSLLPCAMMLLSYFLYKIIRKNIFWTKQNTTASVSNWKSGTLHKAIAFPPYHRRKTVKQNSFQKNPKDRRFAPSQGSTKPTVFFIHDNRMLAERAFYCLHFFRIRPAPATMPLSS